MISISLSSVESLNVAPDDEEEADESTAEDVSSDESDLSLDLKVDFLGALLGLDLEVAFLETLTPFPTLSTFFAEVLWSVRRAAIFLDGLNPKRFLMKNLSSNY